MKVLSFGEILWDVYPDKKYIGGAPLNFSAHLSKMGEAVYMLSAVGKDELGTDALAQLDRWNICNRYVSVVSDKQTGACNVTLDEKMVPKYDLLQNVAYDYIDGSVGERFDVLYFGTLSLRAKHNQNSLKAILSSNNFKEIFVDVNIRPPFYSAQTVLLGIENATVLKISLEEMSIVADLIGMECTDYKQFAKKLCSKYPNLNCIIITLGDDGAYALDCKSGTEYSCGCDKVEVVSTVGAGDSFSAGFLHKYMQKCGIDDCLKFATKIAGFVVSHYDAVPDYDQNILKKFNQ